MFQGFNKSIFDVPSAANAAATLRDAAIATPISEFADVTAAKSPLLFILKHQTQPK